TGAVLHYQQLLLRKRRNEVSKMIRRRATIFNVNDQCPERKPNNDSVLSSDNWRDLLLIRVLEHLFLPEGITRASQILTRQRPPQGGYLANYPFFVESDRLRTVLQIHRDLLSW